MNPVYGPVPSWRLGSSLGIDPICREEKVCSFDCVYCQLGRTKTKTSKRKIFVETRRMEESVRQALEKTKAEVITFSGTGEPTLAENLSDAVGAVRNLTGLPIAVLTNSFLMSDEDVRKELMNLDIVVAKLDAPDQGVFEKINSPVKGIRLDEILEGIKKFRREFPGKLSLQMMFVKENKDCAEEMAGLAREIMPDEVQINTPLRPCASRPLPEREIREIKEKFGAMRAISVYDRDRRIPETEKLDKLEILKRRPE